MTLSYNRNQLEFTTIITEEGFFLSCLLASLLLPSKSRSGDYLRIFHYSFKDDYPRDRTMSRSCLLTVGTTKSYPNKSAKLHLHICYHLTVLRFVVSTFLQRNWHISYHVYEFPSYIFNNQDKQDVIINNKFYGIIISVN